MIKNIQQRPQSKKIKSQLISQRPPTRNINSQQAQKCYQMAKQHQARNQYNQAIQHYAQAVMHNPLHYQAYCNVGVIYRTIQNYNNAISSYVKALSIKRDDYKTIYNLANVYRVVGNPQMAIPLYKQVISKGDNDLKLSSQNNLGISYQNMFQFQQAIQWYEKVIQAQPKYQGGHYNKALCLIYLIRKMDKSYKQTFIRRAQQAQKLLKKVITDLNKSNIMAKVYLQQLKYIQNDSKETYQQCLNSLKEIISKQSSKLSSPMNDQINRKIGVCLAALQRYEQSAKHFQDGVKKIKEDVSRKSSSVNIINEYDSNKIEQNLNVSNPIKKQTQSNYIENESMKKKNSTGSDILNMSDKNENQNPPVKITAQRSLSKSQIQEQQRKIKQRQEFQKKKQQQMNAEKLKNALASVQKLVKLKQYQKAIDVLMKAAPPCKQRTEQKIILLTKYAEQQNDTQYALHAIQAYKFNFLMDNKNNDTSPNIKSNNSKNNNFKQSQIQDCSVQTHQAIAECYTMLDQHKNAIIHYGFVNKWYQQNHKLDDKYIEAQSAISLSYESLGLFEEALKCYKKSLQLNPQNFDINYNLANCYQQANMIDQAIKTYQNCLNLINKSPVEWFKKGDVFVNIGICNGILRNSKEQLQYLQKAMTVFDQNCSNLQDLMKQYNKDFLLDIYLQLANLYQVTLDENSQMNGQAFQKIKQKLLSTYLVLLQFDSCPDRNEIMLNCGNILYQQKLYLNAIEYYQKLDKNIGANYLGVSYLKVSQFSSSYNNFLFNVKENTLNAIFIINFALVDWLFSQSIANIQTEDLGKGLIAFQEVSSCHCDQLFEYKYLFAIQFIDCLTQTLSKDQSIKQIIPISQCDKTIRQTIKFMRQSVKLLNSPSIKQNKSKYVNLKNRQLVFKKFDKHNQNHSLIDQRSKQILISQDDLNFIMKQQDSLDNLKKQFKNLIQKIKLWNKSEKEQLDYYPGLVQTLLSIFIVSNRKNIKALSQSMKQSITLLSTPNLYSVLSKFQVQKIKTGNKLNQDLPVIEMKNPVLLQDLVQQMQQWQLKTEYKFEPLLQVLKQIYWQSIQNVQNVTYPYKTQWNIPKCVNPFQCDQCIIKIATFAKRLFGKQSQFEKNLKQSQKSSIRDKIVNSITQTYYSNHCNNQKGLILKPNQNFYPVCLDFYYKNKQCIEAFINQCIKLRDNNNKQQTTIKSIIFLDSKIKNGESQAVLINSLIKVQFHLGQRDFISQFSQKALQFPLGVQAITLMTIDNTQPQGFPTGHQKDWLTNFKKTIKLNN